MREFLRLRSLAEKIQKATKALVTKFSEPTDFDLSKQKLVWLFALGILGLLFLELPRAGGWVGAYVHKEDGSIFLTDFLHGGFSRTFEIYSGYMHVGPRLIAGGCSTVVGPLFFPACVGASVSLLRVAIAVLAWPIFSSYSRSRVIGLFASTAIVLVPAGQWEVLENITNLRWFLVAAAFFALLVVSSKPGLLTLASTLGLLAALSDPLVILMAPLVILRFSYSSKFERLPSLAIGLGIALQIFAFRPTDRGGAGIFGLASNPLETLTQVIMRGPLTAQFGATINEIALKAVGSPVALATVLLPLSVAIIANLPRFKTTASSLGNLLGLVGIALLLSTISFANLSDLALNDYWAPATPSRYGLLASLFLTPGLVLYICSICKASKKISASRVLALASTLALVAAVLLDFRGDSWNTHGPTWSESVTKAQESCIDSKADPVVSITPTDVPTPWVATLTCDWVLK